MIDRDFEKKWKELKNKIDLDFGGDLDVQGILFLIGVQELNFGIKQYDREEKINVLHVGTCKVLSSFGYYKFDSIDNDGWPHYIELKPLMSLSAKNQENLIKEAILKYLS